MKRIEESAFSPEMLHAYEGKYFSEELETMYTLKVEDDRLMAHHRWRDPFPLTHSDGDLFSGGMWFFGQISFERNPDGTVSGFKAGNGRTQDVWFDKK